MNVAVFPGSFDPFTIGHKAVADAALPLFDKLVIAIGHNTTKSGFFSLDQRAAWIQSVFEGTGKVEVMVFSGLTVTLCEKLGATAIVRGVRSAPDFVAEAAIAGMNRQLNPSIQSVFIPCPDHLISVSATIVREIYRSGGPTAAFLPSPIQLPPL